MSDIIRISLGDWQYNAGIVGLYNILEKFGMDIFKFTQEYVEGENIENIDIRYELCMPKTYLENFTEKYYSYLIDTYINQISYGKIIGFKSVAQDFLKLEDEDWNNEKLDRINSYIRDTLSYYIKSASYKSAFELIEGSDCVVDIVANIKAISIKKKESVLDKKEEIYDVCNKILEVINILEKPEYKKYLGGKNIIYSLIRKNWDGVSVLNRQVKEKDIYKEFDNYFVKSATDYLESDKSKYKYKCFCCESPIKNLDVNLSFLTNTGFDTARKPSHIWFFQNDIAICDFCKLVYSCMPAGFVYGYDKGIFINANSNIEALLNVNSKLKNNVLENAFNGEKSVTYKGIVESIMSMKKESVHYELSDVQVVFYEDEKYRFNILHENILKIILKCNLNLDRLKYGCFKENKKYIYLYEETLKKLFNNQNLFLWINKLIHYYISNKSSCYYTLKNIEHILYINFQYLKEVGLMENKDKSVIESMRKYGWHMRQEYKAKDAVKKIDGISYRMLNSLKTSNVNAFMDILIRCYMYIGKEIPKGFIDCLNSEEEFKTNGYAFVMGFNGVDYRELNDKESNDNDKEVK